MSQRLLLLLCSTFVALLSFAQNTAQTPAAVPSVFQRLGTEMSTYKLDTSAAPDDKITKKILELRRLGGGFNISEAIAFKLEEDRQKKEMPDAELDKLSAFLLEGNGKRRLNNAVVWIYRNRFTYDELKDLVKFYKTSAGQKMAQDFPVIMLQSLAAAEQIKSAGEKEWKVK